MSVPHSNIEEELAHTCRVLLPNEQRTDGLLGKVIATHQRRSALYPHLSGTERNVPSLHAGINSGTDSGHRLHQHQSPFTAQPRWHTPTQRAQNHQFPTMRTTQRNPQTEHLSSLLQSGQGGSTWESPLSGVRSREDPRKDSGWTHHQQGFRSKNGPTGPIQDPSLGVQNQNLPRPMQTGPEYNLSDSQVITIDQASALILRML